MREHFTHSVHPVALLVWAVGEVREVGSNMDASSIELADAANCSFSSARMSSSGSCSEG